MKKINLLLTLCLLSCLGFAQKNTPNQIPLTAEKWDFAPGKVTFSTEKNTSQMQVTPDAGKVVAKDFDFKSGTIEFDVKPGNAMTFYFRYQNAKETECFYLRMGRAGDSLATEGVQYAPYLDGVLMWDTYVEYQSNATFSKDAWNHIKLVVSDAQIRMYVNRPGKPTLEVEHLAGNTERGTIGFQGDMTVKNLLVNPNETEGLSPTSGVDPTANDPRYIRNWAVSEPMTIPEKVDFSYDLLPSPDTKWQTRAAERRGLLNLIRVFGRNETRSIVWLKLKVKSVREQQKRMQLGFVNDVWVFLNGQLAYLDKNLQGSPIEKPPGGRISVENTSFMLPLKEGNNDLLIGIANDAAWGWGAIGRFENTAGIEVSPDPTFDSRLVKIPAKLLDDYAGTFATAGGSLVLTKETNGLRLLGEGGFVINTLLYPRSETRFFSRDFALEFEFVGNRSSADKLNVFSEGKLLVELERVKTGVRDGKVVAPNEEAVRLVNRQFDSSNKPGLGVIALDAREGDGLAILQAVQMAEGTIHVDLKGENKPGSSFVGVAFNIQNDSTYEAVYFRPFNFLANEKGRRAHGVQYVYHPVFTWNKLRTEREGIFEREFENPPSPDGWFSISLTLTPDKVLVKETKTGKRLMEVERLAKPTSEKVGFWVGNGSRGSFKNLIILR